MLDSLEWSLNEPFFIWLHAFAGLFHRSIFTSQHTIDIVAAIFME